MSDVLIIGGGLAGLFSACLAAAKGLDAVLVMSGRGGLSLSHGAIELYASAAPSRSISRLSAPHPYALSGKNSLLDGLKAFLEITDRQGLDYEGGRSSNLRILNAGGKYRPVAYAPTGYLAGISAKSSPLITLGAFTSLRDFYADYALLNSRNNGSAIHAVVELPLLHPFSERELYPLDVARMFDDLDWTIENARAWKPHLVGAECLGLPAVLGLSEHSEVHETLQELLSIPVFEISILPPSIPGLRLEQALRSYAEINGVRIIEGPTATGRVQRQQGIMRVAGAVLDAGGRQSVLDSRSVLIATGSFLHGGLVASQNHKIYERVFNIPVDFIDDRSRWVSRMAFEPQAYSQFGISVNASMQPLDIHGETIFDNLYAAGGILRGADRTLEGSRQGIDIASAFCAVENIAGSLV